MGNEGVFATDDDDVDDNDDDEEGTIGAATEVEGAVEGINSASSQAQLNMLSGDQTVGRVS